MRKNLLSEAQPAAVALRGGVIETGGRVRVDHVHGLACHVGCAGRRDQLIVGNRDFRALGAELDHGTDEVSTALAPAASCAIERTDAKNIAARPRRQNEAFPCQFRVAIDVAGRRSI